MKKEDLQKKCDELGLKYQDNDTVEQLQHMIKGQEAIDKVAKLETELQEARDLNAELNASISSSETEAKTGAPTVKHDGKVYSMPIEKMGLTVLSQKTLGVSGSQITREMVKKDKKLLAKLIETKSGFLVEVED